MIPLYLAFCGLAWAVSRSWVPVAIAFGLVLTRLAAELPDGITYPAYSAIWVTVGGAAIYRDAIFPGLLLIASGLCYLWADLSGVSPVVGELPLVAADVLGLIALVAAGVSGGTGGGIGKGRDLGRNHSGRGNSVGGGVVVMASKEGQR
jgi:hypothetical protein